MSIHQTILKGTSVIAGGSVFGRLISFVTVPILTRVLGPEPYGVAALLGTIVALGSVVALLGIDMAYMRFRVQSAAEQQQAVERFCWRHAIFNTLNISFLSALFWWFFGGFWISDHREFTIFVAFAIVLSALATMASTKTRLEGEYGRIAISSIAGTVVSAGTTICVALFWQPNAWALLFGVLASSVISVAILIVPPITELLSSSGLSRARRLEIISLGVAGSVTAPIHWLLSSSDRWFVLAYGGAAEAGIYSMAVQFALLGLLLNSSIAMTWFPEISRDFERDRSGSLPEIGRNSSHMIALLAVAWVAVSAAGGDLIRLLAAHSFHQAAVYVPWLAGGVLCYGASNIFITGLFLSNKMRYVSYIWIAGGAVGVILYFQLGYYWGALGVSVAQLLSYLFIASASFFVSQRVMPIPLPWARLGIAGVVVLFAAVAMSFHWDVSPIISLVMKAPVGIAVSLVVTFLVAPEFITKQVAFLRVKG